MIPPSSFRRSRLGVPFSPKPCCPTILRSVVRTNYTNPGDLPAKGGGARYRPLWEQRAGDDSRYPVLCAPPQRPNGFHERSRSFRLARANRYTRSKSYPPAGAHRYPSTAPPTLAYVRTVARLFVYPGSFGENRYPILAGIDQQ